MAASTDITHGDHAVELIVCDSSASSTDASADDGGGAGSASEEIAPLLMPPEKPKINIFSVSYSRRKPREHVSKLPETETSPLEQFVLWVWGGSRYSGIMCTALSSATYFVMEVLTDFFSARSIPLFETAFTRCTIIMILSYVWLRRCGQPIFGAAHARKLLFLRALMGYLSLMSFIYCIQRLPLSQAIVLSFTTPIMASMAARIMLREKLKISDIGGLACSFFGVLFIYRQILRTQGVWSRSGETNNTNVRGSYHVYTVLIALFSSIAGGISCCLVKAGAKASDQPVVTVFSFGLLSSPAAGICAFVFEVFLARGLLLEKTSKAANVLYIEAALSQLWGIGSSRISSSFGGLVGCLLILMSVGCTMYIGPDKEME